MRQTLQYYLINAITVYRLVMGPVLILLVIFGQIDIFKWLLPVSFFTDLIDGTLARKYRVSTKLGAILDSYADDLTVASAIIGMFLLKHEFAMQHFSLFIFVMILFVLQTAYALYKYKRLTSFHTYLAKLAAILQGIFFILLFLLPQPQTFLFYAAVLITALELIEEIVLVFLLPNWVTDIKGIFWVNKKK